MKLNNTRPSNPFSNNINQSGISGYNVPSRQTEEGFRQKDSHKQDNNQWVGEYIMNE